MRAIILSAIRVVGVGASPVMAGMPMGSEGQATGGQPPGILAFLLQARPVFLLVSIAAFALSLAVKRWVTAILALLVGGVIYYGMYGQPRLPMMSCTMTLGLLGWAAIYLWARSFTSRKAPAT